jgi:Glutaredoxin-like domain (DUF836)
MWSIGRHATRVAEANSSARIGIRAIGAPGRNRTADASLRTAALYPLSYGGAGRIVPRCTIPTVAPPLPDLVLYTRPGCHLCDESRQSIDAVLAAREAAGLPIPQLVETDIRTSEALETAFGATIPVVELGSRRLELAVSAGRIRRLLADVLDDVGTAD